MKLMIANSIKTMNHKAKNHLVWPLVLTLALTGCTKKNNQAETTETATETETSATADQTAPVSNSALPAEAKKAAEPFLAKGSPTALFFFADWCPACRAFKPTLEEVESKNPSVKVVRMNVDEQKDVTKAFKVTSIPSLFFFDKDGKFVESTTGGLSNEKLQEEFNKVSTGASAPAASTEVTKAPEATTTTTTTTEVKKDGKVVEKTADTTTTKKP
jgi:thioredoxin 1